MKRGIAVKARSRGKTKSLAPSSRLQTLESLLDYSAEAAAAQAAPRDPSLLRVQVTQANLGRFDPLLARGFLPFGRGHGFASIVSSNEGRPTETGGNPAIVQPRESQVSPRQRGAPQALDC